MYATQAATPAISPFPLWQEECHAAPITRDADATERNLGEPLVS